MKEIQYRMDEFDTSNEKNLHKHLSVLGKKGWELVSVVQSQTSDYVHTLYFKREINKKNKP